MPTTTIRKRWGCLETENVVADAGASYDIDLSNGGVHKITLTQDCDITLSGIDAAASNSATLIVEQDRTGGTR